MGSRNNQGQGLGRSGLLHPGEGRRTFEPMRPIERRQREQLQESLPVVLPGPRVESRIATRQCVDWLVAGQGLNRGATGPAVAVGILQCKHVDGDCRVRRSVKRLELCHIPISAGSRARPRGRSLVAVRSLPVTCLFSLKRQCPEKTRGPCSKSFKSEGKRDVANASCFSCFCAILMRSGYKFPASRETERYRIFN